MKTNKTFSLDRFEGDIAVCLDEENNSFDFPKQDVPLSPGSLFSADVEEDGKISHVVFLEEKTAQLKKENKSRLNALLNRKANR